MFEFQDLKSLCQQLEDQPPEHLLDAYVSRMFDQVKKSGCGHLSEAELIACEWEATVFHVHFQEGDVRPANFDDPFDEETYTYLRCRLEETHNPFLKARYSHVLWVIPTTKHDQYARIAVDSYAQLMKILERKVLEEQEGFFGLHLQRAVGNAYSLAYQTKYRWDEIKSEVRRMVLYFDFANPASFNLRRDFIGLMLDSKRKLKKEDLEGLAEVCWQLFQSMLDRRRGELALEALELGQKVNNRTGSQTHDWISEQASCHEKLMNIYRNTPNEFMHCRDALTTYKRAGQWEKVRELEGKYYQIKAAMPVATFAEEIDLTEHEKHCEDLAQQLAHRDEEDIMAFFMCGKNLLPDASVIDEQVRQQTQDPQLLDRLPCVFMDEQGHPIQHFSEPEEKHCLNVLQHYGAHLELDKLILLQKIITTLIQAGKLSGEILLSFLERNTWLGRNMISARPGGRNFEYRWLDLIAPAVKDLFRFFERESPGHHQGAELVLGIDSLTLKLEGLLRCLCDAYGVSTLCTTQDANRRQIFKEKDLKALLHDEALKDILDPSDLLFFKFLLVEHPGYNLRNRIAHCLMLSPDLYSVDYAVLLITALLRISKYRLGRQGRLPT